MIIPDWLPFALAAAVCAAAVPLVQERFRAPPLALSLVIKVCMALAALPFVLASGLPTGWLFYAATIGMGALWFVSDIMFFNAVRVVGAGPVSRLLPGMTIVSFLLWFLIDPALILQYAQLPWRSAGIALCVVASAFCAMRLKNCAVSRQAVRLLWFVMLMNAIAPISQKLLVEIAHAPTQAPFAVPFIVALTAIFCWGLYVLARRGQPLAPFRDPAMRRPALQAGALLGVIMAAASIVTNFGMLRVDHPAYLTVVIHGSVLLVILAHRLLGIRDDSDVRAGLGIVASAAILVLLKSL